MVLKTWQYARGHVRMAVRGFAVERFINMAAFRGVYIWDVERVEGGVDINVSISGFWLLRGIGRKTGCETKILAKHGLPFTLHRYRKRKLLMGGVAAFVLALFLLSSFIWRVDIVGTEELAHSEIINFLGEQGLGVGTFKHGVNTREVHAALLDNFPQISWAQIHTRGTRTTVSLVEALPPQPIVDRTTPAHIVAARDGLITGIVTASGAPKVRQNDIVREGDVLVSGIIELTTETAGIVQSYVQAYAEVWARFYHTLEFAIPLEFDEKLHTGRVATRRHVQFLFGNERRLAIWHIGGTISFDSYDKITTRHQPGVGGDYPLPFVIIREKYAEYTPVRRTRTPQEAMDLADRVLTERILSDFDFATDIINKEVSFAQTDTAIWVMATITTNERIDRLQPITVPTPQIPIP